MDISVKFQQRYITSLFYQGAARQVHLYFLAFVWPPLCCTRSLERDSNIYSWQGR